MKCRAGWVAWAWLALLAQAHAETSNVSAAGFTSTFREEVKATPDEVWKAIVQLPRWWSDAHTYSGKASNLSLDADAGLDKLAAVVDQVIGAQYRRLKSLSETGKPE